MIKSWISAFVETRRLIWLLGIVFAVVLLIQHFEIPYSGVLPSLLAAGKPHVASGDNSSHVSSSTDPKVPKNLTSNWSDANSSVSVNEVTTGSAVLDRQDGEGVKNLSVGQSQSSDNLTAGVSDPEDENISSDTLGSSDSLATDEANKSKDGKIASSSANGRDYSLNRSSKADTALSPENGISKFPISSVAAPNSAMISPENVDMHLNGPATPANPSSWLDGNATALLPQNNTIGLLKPNVAPSINKVPMKKDRSKPPPLAVVTISQMNDMLMQSRASYRAMRPRWSSSLDQQLSRAKSLIENAPPVRDEPSLYSTLFRNVSMFRRSYELMEKTLQVYIYPEGESPIFHHAVLEGIYASEGWFMKLLKANKMFVTKKPTQAHLFYLPFSSRMLEEVLYVPDSHSRRNLVRHLSNYLNVITSKYRFWNRTGGADHFLVACHDWAPSETQKIMAKCIRALCNSDLVDEGFTFGKDVSLPETYVRMAKDPLRERGGKPPSKRHILAFFAGGNHGYLRPILLEYWKNDPDLKFFGKLPTKGKINYVRHMKSSKYCICAKGYEVNSPRVVEAIFYECVPVIISDNFVPPFYETLNWESFAVFVLEKDIPNLKDILKSIPEKRYLAMQRRVKQVQRHFLWNTKPVKYDIFHMILHSIWYTRVFQLSPR
ncbi:hypothetical protein Leryth_003542 [Lithospermum erythrorhizon]|nr:hypothetical protein Leryth_003542 [Lithospermum erythrorhizon]